MTIPKDELVSLYEQWIYYSEQILKQDFENADENHLFSFIQKKEELIRQIKASNEKMSESTKLICAQCIELDQLVSEKLKYSLMELELIIQKLNNSKKVRQTYQYEEISSMGYFVDNQR